jgi:hypothetical protein
MANRRQFIQGGASLSAASGIALAGVPRRARAAQQASVSLAGFVYDSRFADAREIARHAGRHGATLWEISGDLFDLWSDHLDPLWREAPAAIAGVTTEPDLFVIEDMAADRRMKVVYRGEHGVTVRGAVSHRLAGPEALFAKTALAQNPDLWAPLLGRAMVEVPAGPAPAATLDLKSPALSARREPLYSWVIAPRSRPASA